MGQVRLDRALQLGDNALGQHFAQFDAPLVEGIDAPDGALGEYRVLVERDQLAEGLRRKLFGEDRVRRAVALKYPVRYQPVRRTLRFHLLRSFSESQRFGLRADIRQQHVVVPAQRIERFAEGDEVAGDQPGPLMNQLIERMLSVGAWFAPVDRASRVSDLRPIQRDVLAVALHSQLLQVSRESLQVLFIRQNGDRLGAEEVGVPDGQQSQQHWQIALERSGAEVFVHLVEAAQHRPEIVGTYGQHGGKTNR